MLENKIISFILIFFAVFAFAKEQNLDDFEQEYQNYQVNDPLSGYNKAMTSFNVALYDYGLRPVLKGYNTITPEFIRLGVRNFFDNLLAPLRFVGNILQFKLKKREKNLKIYRQYHYGLWWTYGCGIKMGLKNIPRT